MRQEDDKTIVDPETWQPVPRMDTKSWKTPGLFVDQMGNVYIASTTPATILINGRETKMSTADLATLLKSLPQCHSVDRDRTHTFGKNMTPPARAVCQYHPAKRRQTGDERQLLNAGMQQRNLWQPVRGHYTQ